MAETNLDALDINSLQIGNVDKKIFAEEAAQTLSGDGAITIKNGVVLITKGSAAAITLANPTTVTDDYKELNILSTTAFAHTVTIATTGFGNGGGGKDVATFAAAAGAGMRLMAYGGFWYIRGSFDVTVA